MNNEKMNQIIDEVYRNFNRETFIKNIDIPIIFASDDISLRDRFVEKIKTDSDFSEKWGLKIEESELSFNERCEIQINQLDGMYSSAKDMFIKSSINEVKLEMMNRNNIPTKLIKVTYNNETVEIYE